jgi:hypothetical protein
VNERNVAALEKVLDEIADLAGYVEEGPRTIAEHLASHGVLVPSALTDEEVWAALAIHHEGVGNHAPTVRSELERIAKGE